MAKNMAEVAEETARNAADAGWSVLVLRLHQKGEFKVTGARPPSEAAWDVAGAIAAVERIGWRLEHFNGGVSTWMHGGTNIGSQEEWDGFTVFRRNQGASSRSSGECGAP